MSAATKLPLFAGDLLKMYLRYAESHGLKTEIITENANDAGGIKEAIIKITGNEPYAQLKFESGVHRVQRVPVTESQGRVHTSTATVAVLPRGQRNRRSHRSQGSTYRHLSFIRSWWPGCQYNRLRRAYYPLANRLSGHQPGRPLTDPEQRKGHGGSTFPSAPDGNRQTNRC